MFTNVKYILVLLSVLTVLKYLNADCAFDYKDDFPTVPSVLLTLRVYTQLLEPDRYPIRLNYLESIIIACPGEGNAIKILGASSATGVCNNGTNLYIGGKNYQLSQLGCTKSVYPICTYSFVNCGNSQNGYLIHIKYEIDGFLFPTTSVYEICYNINSSNPLYVKHSIYKQTIFQAKDSVNRSSFKTLGCVESLTEGQYENAYTQATQLKTFEKLLSSQQLATKYIIPNKSFLVKGHLNPNGDQVLETSSTATYLYMNTLPMWQIINNGNWKSLEISIRNFAKNYRDLEILTGGHDILTLPDIHGIEREIYLDDNNKQLQVPKYLWKIIIDKSTNNGIGFIALNNPFNTNYTMNICTNICNNMDWGTSNWGEPSRGLLYCCSIEELMQVIPQIPTDYASNNNNNMLLRGLDS